MEAIMQCSDCNAAVTITDPYYSSPCGTFCKECMEAHMEACGICGQEFDHPEREE